MFRTFGPAVADALEGVELVDPDVVYAGGSAEIDLGGRVARLRTRGLAHTGGDQVVFLPEERIVFGGDLFETRMFPIVPWCAPRRARVERATSPLDPRSARPGGPAGRPAITRIGGSRLSLDPG